ncbi:MAG: sigma 54-interacting transcriptional regulator [Deltaproteobacteria bacterium]|nr:sigma 54-interacting transcriptional regulator [Deltaproteobacteria bacterium]
MNGVNVPLTPEKQTRIILDSIADGVFTVDKDWKITSFNHAAEKITGIPREQALGRHCWDVFRAGICENRCSLRRTMETGTQIINQAIFIVNSSGERVPVSISTALLKDEKGEVIGGVETFRDLSVVEALRKELEGRHSFADIISKNPTMRRLFRMIEQVAETDATVLLTGESGTGKELFARAIHSLSGRRKGPLITVNCGALPDSLLESELFGHRAGAFTGASKDRPGRVTAAEGGTLFLDEIGDVSPRLQISLLRLLQEKTYEPLGQTKPLKADVRIVAATNRDLQTLVRRGTFREDLYYRVNVVKLDLPPLRDRKEDIPLLAEHFVRKYNRLNGKEIRGISPEVLSILMSYDFPGNVRELQNLIEYASVICTEDLIGPRHLPDYLRPGVPRPRIREAAPTPSLRDMERDLILGILEKNAWSRKDTAQQLGIHPSTLWRKMKRYRISSP